MSQESVKGKVRWHWLDMAKGYGILLVMWAHLIDEGCTVWIYSFHMPLFFFLSGYVFTTKDSFCVFLKKRVRNIIVPYFGLGIPIVFFEAACPETRMDIMVYCMSVLA